MMMTMPIPMPMGDAWVTRWMLRFTQNRFDLKWVKKVCWIGGIYPKEV